MPMMRCGGGRGRAGVGSERERAYPIDSDDVGGGVGEVSVKTWGMRRRRGADMGGDLGAGVLAAKDDGLGAHAGGEAGAADVVGIIDGLDERGVAGLGEEADERASFWTRG
jgi:hypothetical protein